MARNSEAARKDAKRAINDLIGEFNHEEFALLPTEDVFLDGDAKKVIHGLVMKPWKAAFK